MENTEKLREHDCSYLKTLPKYELRYICEYRHLPSHGSRLSLKTSLEHSGFIHGFIGLPASFDRSYFSRLSPAALSFLVRKFLPAPHRLDLERIQSYYPQLTESVLRWNQRQELVLKLHTRFGLCKSVTDIMRSAGERHESGCVYFLRDPSAPLRLKIGKSGRGLPITRVKQQINHNLVDYEVAFFVRTQKSGLVETALHKELYERRVHGDPANDGATEWFEVTLEEAVRWTKVVTSAIGFWSKCVGV